MLDYLARELIDSGWSIKSTVRKIVLSQTFALSSEYHESSHEKDPENAWYWRYPLCRLDPESMRDSMLSIAGALDLRPLNSTVHELGDQATAVGENKVRRRTNLACRSVYLPVIRNDLPEIFEVFDFADPHSTTGLRRKTMVPGQALFMLNSDLFMETGKTMATQMQSRYPAETSLSELVFHMYEAVHQRQASAEDRDRLVQFIERMENELPTSIGSDRSTSRPES